MKYIITLMLGTCIGTAASYYLMPIAVSKECVKSSTPEDVLTQHEIEASDPCEDYELIPYTGENF